MTTKEKIEVMQAFIDGKQIQQGLCYIGDIEWEDVYSEPIWRWDYYEYRIKPNGQQPKSSMRKLRPYANAEEFLQAMRAHGPYVTNDDNLFRLAKIVSNVDVILSKETFTSYQTLYEHYVWQDKTPCGIEEE